MKIGKLILKLKNIFLKMILLDKIMIILKVLFIQEKHFIKVKLRKKYKKNYN